MAQVGPTVKFDEKVVLDTTLQLVRERGFEAISAQSVAHELGCSVHPIYRAFDSMDGLKTALVKAAWTIFDKRLLEALADSSKGFLSMGLALVAFAKDEPLLFKLMFMSNVIDDITLSEFVTDAFDNNEVIEAISLSTGISEEHARELFAACYFQAHGVAALFATNACRFTDEEVRHILYTTGSALIGAFRRKEEDEKNNR